MIFRVKTRFYEDENTQKGDTVITRREIPLDNVRSVEEVYNGTKVLKTRCLLVCDPPINNVMVQRSFDSVIKALETHKNIGLFEVKGFIRYEAK